MEIGTFISLKRFNVETKEMENYHCKVIDKNEDYFYIDYPINVNTKRTEMFRINERVIAYYIEKGIAHEFKATILERVHKNVPGLKLKLPTQDEINRIQRREYVRIETDVDVAIHCPNNTFAPFISVTEDISGGGAKIYNPPESLKEEQKLKLYLVLPVQDGYEYIETDAEVVRIHESNQVKTVSVKFLIDHEVKRQKIVQYCFYIQRKNRQQGIL